MIRYYLVSLVQAILWCAMLFMVSSTNQSIYAQVDFGNYQSSTLVARAWEAMGKGKYDDVLVYVAKCEELYGEEAKRMQESLADYPNADTANQYWALNDVGTILFIKGETLLKKGDKKGALEAFKKLVQTYKFAQCWDPKGWFWKPAEVAKQKIMELEFDTK